MPKPRGKSQTPPGKKDEAGTPQAFVDALALREGVSFALDPFATAENTKAPRFYTREQDGFRQPWDVGDFEAVFANPPYSGDNKARACQKALDDIGLYYAAYLLLPSDTGTSWFAEYGPRAAKCVFVRGRVQYVGDYANGNDTDSLLLVFSRFMVGMSWEDFWEPTPEERGCKGRSSRRKESLCLT